MTVTTTLSPEDELKKKQEDLKKAQDGVSVLQAEIKALQAKVAEFQKATEGYDKFFDTATKQLQEAKNKITDKTTMAKSVIPESVAKDIDEQIQDRIKVFNETLTTQKGVGA